MFIWSIAPGAEGVESPEEFRAWLRRRFAGTPVSGGDGLPAGHLTRRRTIALEHGPCRPDSGRVDFPESRWHEGRVKAVFRTGPGARRSPFERFLVSHPMGDIIFSEGEIGTEMYIIQSGTVELLKEIGGEYPRPLAPWKRATSSGR